MSDADLTATHPGATPAAPAGLPTLPGYEVESELGRGGMGVVYRARERATGRTVALKMILSGRYASEKERARFHAEATSAAAVSHPNVVQVLTLGEHDGHPFLALEFCPGGTLADRLAAGPFAPTEAARLVAEIAGAVGAAHAQRVVHRDLKPANVLFDAAGRAKVADFGLAKRLDSEAGLTPTYAMLGTPDYMAPEQAAGHAYKVGPAADIYALGAILYHALAGKPPFQSSTFGETLMRVMRDEPALIRTLNIAVPRDLESIALKCLAKRPEDRYATAVDLAADLRRQLAGESVSARPMGWGVLVRRRLRRHAALMAAVGVAVAALAAAGVMAAGRGGNGDAGSALAPVAAEALPQRYALLVGVNKYERGAILEHADYDANNFAKTLLGAGYAGANVIVLSTEEPAESLLSPKGANIRRELTALCARVRPGDSIVVTFSGYEKQYPGSDEYYLRPSDGKTRQYGGLVYGEARERGEQVVEDDTSYRSTLVSLSEVTAALAASEAASKAVIIDSCRSAEGVGGAHRPKEPPPGVAVLFACSTGESTIEVSGDNSRGGVFTQRVCKALRGGANGRVTWGELVSGMNRLRFEAPDGTWVTNTPELLGSTPDFPIAGKP